METQRSFFDANKARFQGRFYSPRRESAFAPHSRRYIGSKHKLSSWILSIIKKERPPNGSFADIFAGTGAVGSAARGHFKKIILNDFLYSNYAVYKAFFEKGDYSGDKILALINEYSRINPDSLPENYISKNFGGKYFSNGAARMIGFIRQNIEEMRRGFTDKEYYILLASLIYSADKIANTAGHYDAYFKKRLVKDSFRMRAISPAPIKSLSVFREDANLLVKKIKADVVYIDPPYNSRQYSRFYHVLETLVKWDKPPLFGAALKPPRENMSAYCREAAKEKFSELIQNINAKYIVVSYNNTYNPKSSSSKNKISLERIKSVLSERGATKVFEKNYRYFNAGGTHFKDHKEHLFVTKVFQKNSLRRSPLFYVGDKYKLMSQLKDVFPQTIANFYEPFTGGGTVFLNIKAKKYFLNDINKNIINIHKMLLQNSSHQKEFFKKLEKKIQQYSLSFSYKKDIVPNFLKKKFKKTYYAKFNKEGYENLRKEINRSAANDPLILYILLIYGFNRMLRFNKAREFNLPVGNVDFNQNAANALNNYFSFAQKADIQLTSLDFKKFFEKKAWSNNDFVYLDPPYLIAGSEYNKLWNENNESDLLELLSGLNKLKVRFALSNIIEYNEKRNNKLIEWMKKYNVHKIKSNYISYHNNGKKNIKEVLITNY